MQITYYTERHSQTVPAEQLATLLKSPEGALWIDIHGPTDADSKMMREVFGFHPLAIEDVYNQRQRPKAEEFVDHLFVVLNPIAEYLADPPFRELDVFVGRNYLVTAHLTDEPVILEAQKRLAPERIAFAISATYLLYVLTDTVIDGYFPILETIEHEIETLGNEIIDQPQPQALNRLFQLKRALNEVWWTVGPQQDIVSVLMNHNLVFIDPKSRYYLRDVSDHLQRATASVQAARDTVPSLINLYMSSVSNQVSYAVTRLTIVTICLGTLAAISGFYGMNFEHTWPPFHHPQSALVVASIMMAAVFLIYFVFRWRKWIR